MAGCSRVHFGKSEVRFDSQPKSVLQIAAENYAQAARGRHVRSGCNTFGLGRDRQTEWRFQEEFPRVLSLHCWELRWSTRRRFDPSSSPSATLTDAACSPRVCGASKPNSGTDF